MSCHFMIGENNITELEINTWKYWDYLLYWFILLCQVFGVPILPEFEINLSFSSICNQEKLII